MTISRPRHPKPSVEKAIQYAEKLGWRVKISKRGHAWGKLLCPLASRMGCIITVWSTPKNEDNHARHIQNKVDSCDCEYQDPDNDSPTP